MPIIIIRHNYIEWVPIDLNRCLSFFPFLGQFQLAINHVRSFIKYGYVMLCYVLSACKSLADSANNILENEQSYNDILCIHLFWFTYCLSIFIMFAVSAESTTEKGGPQPKKQNVLLAREMLAKHSTNDSTEKEGPPPKKPNKGSYLSMLV